MQKFDVCIVGAGAAGIALAQRLIGSPLNVLLLSSGTPAERGRPPEQRQSIYRGTTGDFLSKVDPIFLTRSRLHMHGGTTNHFGFWSRPLDPIDFAPRPGFREAGWQFGLDELAPYYADAHHFGHFGAFNYDDLPFWESALYARSFPPRAGDALTGAIMRAQYAEPLHDFQVQFGDALRDAHNVTVLFNAHLQRIETDAARTHVTGLLCATLENGARGRSFTVQAARVVLALGGIETVRALKLSDDLGDNPRGHLGRGFMVHPLITDAAHVTFARSVDRDIAGFFRDQQIRLQPDADGTPAFAPLVNPEYIDTFNVFNAWGVLVPTVETMQRENIGNFRFILRFNAARDEAILNLNWEQIPNEDSRITLDSAHSDPIFGQPVSHLDWRLCDADKRTAARALALCDDYLRGQGAVAFAYLTDVSGGADAWTFPPNVGALATGDHHMGALRMSASPEDGIVNADCRLHTVENLYIAGCGVFPTGGFANPTLTLVALALRLGDHLKTQPAAS
ncbi:MAG: GMC oxidoreductase [Chloroflexota bacterium]|nr:GMC oxidoreductase [Chloroflexota bacterium]